MELLNDSFVFVVGASLTDGGADTLAEMKARVRMGGTGGTYYESDTVVTSGSGTEEFFTMRVNIPKTELKWDKPDNIFGDVQIRSLTGESIDVMIYSSFIAVKLRRNITEWES